MYGEYWAKKALCVFQSVALTTTMLARPPYLSLGLANLAGYL
jgi:hypothetical protein